jgi:tetrahydromethanopterin S-methyltransferase subunit C
VTAAIIGQIVNHLVIVLGMKIPIMVYQQCGRTGFVKAMIGHGLSNMVLFGEQADNHRYETDDIGILF